MTRSTVEKMTGRTVTRVEKKQATSAGASKTVALALLAMVFARAVER
jgi:hypothetical protein